MLYVKIMPEIFSGIILTIVQVVFITTKITFIFKSFFIYQSVFINLLVAKCSQLIDSQLIAS